MSAYLEKFKPSCHAADLSPLSSFGLTFNSRLFNPVSCRQDSPVRGKHQYPIHQHFMLSETHKFIPRTLYQTPLSGLVPLGKALTYHSSANISLRR